MLKRKKNEKKCRQFKRPLRQHQAHNICIIGVPEGEERQKGPEKILEEIIAKNFSNIRKETVTQVQEAQRVPYWINTQMNTLRNIVIKMTKIKDEERILREKQQITYKGTLIRLSAHFSAETLQARREWHNIRK